MRLRDRNFARGLIALTLGVSLGSCGGSGGDYAAVASANDAERTGPAADYPVVLGEPYSVDGKLYTPSDTLNYDEVGYAGALVGAGPGVSASHRTLPLPSYVEVTSLESGRTILVRVEDRGPMAGSRLVGLSQDAARQLGIEEGAPIRVRRVNPPETDRAKLRMDETAPERMETPASLLAVLKRKLPEKGSAPLIAAKPANGAAPVSVATAQTSELPPVGQAETPASSDYSLAPLESVAVAPSAPAPTAAPTPVATPPRNEPKPALSAAALSGDFVVQAAAFSVRANADRAAKALGGFVVPGGKYFRVRTGPFDSRGEAQAALAKVKAAGYSDARVSTAG